MRGAVKRSCLAVIVVLVGLVAGGLPASADEIPVPDVAGAEALCNVEVRNVTGVGGVTQGLWFSCVYGNAAGTSGAPTTINLSIEYDYPAGPWGAAGHHSGLASSVAMTCGGGLGAKRCQGSTSWNGHTGITNPSVKAGGSGGTYNYATWTGPIWRLARGAAALGSAITAYPEAHYPAWPEDWYPGGLALYTNITLPGYTCERELVLQPDGAWVANLDADGPTGLPAGAESGVITAEQWYLPWDLENPVPKVSTVTLPATGKPPGGWRLRFEASVTLTEEYRFPAIDPNLSVANDLLDSIPVWYTSATDPAFDGDIGTHYHAYVGWTLDNKRHWLRVFDDGTFDLDITDSHGTVDPAVRVPVGPLDISHNVGPAVLGYAQIPYNEFTPTPSADINWAIFKLVDGGDWEPDTSDVLHEATMDCWVTLDVDRPQFGGGGEVGSDTPPEPGEGGSGSSEGCSAGPLGSVPLIGGVFDSTARLACTLADLLGKVFAFLLRLFIPETLEWEGTFDGVSARFPLNLVTDLLGAGGSIKDAVTVAKDNGEACPSMDASSIVKGVNIPGGERDWGLAFNPKLPTPSDSGCASIFGGARTDLEDKLGDLFGFRGVIRNLLLLGMYVWLFFKVIAAFGDGKTGLEPVDDK